MTKPVFKFYMPDGAIGTMEGLAPSTAVPVLITPQEEEEILTPEFVAQRQSEYEAFLTSNMYNERIWRDTELHLTDRLMLEDSQYEGQVISGTQYKTDILVYRAELHAYDMKYEPRPVRPTWFTGFAPGS